MTDFSPPPGQRPEDEPGYGNAEDHLQGRPPSTWGQAPAPSPFGPEPGSSPPGQPAESTAGAGAPSGPGPAAYGATYPRQSMAVPALVLSIAGLACCGITAPIGLIMAAVDLRAMTDGRTDPAKRGTARAALIVGVISTVLFVGMVLLWVLLGAIATTTGSVN